MDIDSFDKISFQYNTGQIPPPFCFRYVIDVALNEKENYQGKLELEYFDRDELTEEEIFDEGFSLDDNYAWEGVIPGIWGKEIIEKVKSASWKKNLSVNEDGSEFVVKLYKDNRSELVQPSDVNSWVMFMQEVMQSIFEISKKEAPLEIGFFKKDSSEQMKYDITYFFSSRSVELAYHQNKKSIDWLEGQKLLKYIFGIDYLPEDGSEKLPRSQGTFISPGDGFWYPLDPKQNQGKVASKIERLTNLMEKYAK